MRLCRVERRRTERRKTERPGKKTYLRCRSVSVGVGRCRSVSVGVYCLLRLDAAAAAAASSAAAAAASESLIWFTTHLRSACLSGSVMKLATSSLICCVRTLSEIVLRRIVSGFRMLRRMVPADAVICAC